MAKTNIGLVAYITSKLALPTIYMLSGFGRVLLGSEVDRRIKAGCAHTIANQKTIRAKSVVKRTDASGKVVINPHLTIPNAYYCFDCVGLIKGYLWESAVGAVAYNIPAGTDQNVGGMYRSATQKGALSTMPDILGLLVFTEDLGHVGIYVGKKNGVRQYIEATPAWGAWGVTTSADNSHPQGHNRKWAFWGKYHLIEYIVTPDIHTVVKGDTLDNIAKRYNTTWQNLYNLNKQTIGSNYNLIELGMVLRLREDVIITPPAPVPAPKPVEPPVVVPPQVVVESVNYILIEEIVRKAVKEELRLATWQLKVE